MKRASKRIIIISEQVNKYRFRALVDGIDTVAYNNNPIMLWMHIRAFGDRQSAYLPIGNVIELRIENIEGVGKCLTGQPMFSEVYDFAKEICDLYEEGTIRMASAGLIPVEWSDEPELLQQGQTGATLVRSILEEISIVDIGADGNALSIALYNENHELIQLSSTGVNATIPLINHPDIKNEMKKIELTAEKLATILGKQEIATADQAEHNIMEVVQLAHRQKTEIQNLTTERDNYKQKLEDIDKVQLKADTNTLLDGAVEARKITADEKAYYADQVSDRPGLEKLKLHLDSKGTAAPVSQILGQQPSTNLKLYAGKTWSELDRAGKLLQLKKDDLNYFKQLYKETYGREYKD